MDKAAWKQIAANDFNLPEGHTAAEFLPELVGFLSSPDQELRDDIAYMAFAMWIGRDKHFTPDDLRGLITTLTANLNIDLGEVGTDSALTRSFSALALSVIAYHDNHVSFLTTDEIHALLNKVLVYLAAEDDLRGYVEGIGWVHAVAHTADVLKFLARNPKTDVDDHRRILDAIADKLTTPVTHIYVHDEDERLVRAVYDIMGRDTLSLEAYKTWLERFKTWKASWPEGGQFVVTTHAPYMNCKHFIRSLYLTVKALADSELPPEKAALKKLATGLLPEVENLLPIFGTGTIYAAG